MNEGLKHLAIQAQKHRIQFKDSSKVVIMPLFAFLDQLLNSMKKYANSLQSALTWGQFLVISTPDRIFSNLYGSWLSYNLKSLQTKLISTLLSTNSPPKISMFLKLRKFVLKTKPDSLINLDSIQLEHSDIIGIVHSVYQNQDTRKQITEGIKSLFISYRMQQAKLHSCVFVEYALSLHEEIYARENNQATISQQHNSYGTVPQSILGFSSIVSQNSQNPRASQSQAHNPNQTNNSSQYISNFQSVIHDENGLYRKVKSSQVSLQGFKVIDHKFVNNSPERNSRVQQSYSQSKIGKGFGDRERRNNLSVIGEEREMGRESDVKGKGREREREREEFQIYGNQRRMKTEHQGFRRTQSKAYNNAMTPTKYRPQDQPIQNPMVRSGTKNSKIDPARSPTYTEKYRSPGDIEFDPSPIVSSNLKFVQLNNNSKSKVDRSLAVESSHKRSQNSPQSPQPHPQPEHEHESTQLKLIKAQQQQQQAERLRAKKGGYNMFKKLTERNKSFIEKMLTTNLDRRQLALRQASINPDGGQGQGYESISVIHDSIVRHSGADRWAEGRMNGEGEGKGSEKKGIRMK